MKKLLSAILLVTVVSLSIFSVSAAPNDNIASIATITTSSDYSEEYAGVKVADGAIGTQDAGEWASAGEVDPWINFEFSEEKWVNKIAVYDRNNVDDHSETINVIFSDGSTLQITDVSNTGEPSEITFEPKKVKSIKMEIVGIETSKNNGLSEVEIYECEAPAVIEPVTESAAVEEITAETTAAVEETTVVAPVVTSEETTVTTPVVVSVPPTGDFTIPVIVALVLSGACFIIILKRKNNKA